MSAAYPNCEKHGLEIYEEEIIDAFPVENLIERLESECERYRAKLQEILENKYDGQYCWELARKALEVK